MPTREQRETAVCRGVQLFRFLVERRNEHKECLGILLPDFISFIYDADYKSYREVRGKNFSPEDIPWVLEHANEVTEEERPLVIGDVGRTIIRAGMEAFIWDRNRNLPDMSLDTRSYNRRAWSSVFPASQRTLLGADEFERVYE